LLRRRASADYKGDDGSVTMRIKVNRKKAAMAMLSRRPGRLGIELDPDNRIVSLMSPATGSGLQIGDYILEVDGFPLGEEMLVTILDKNNLRGPEHELRIRREVAASS
jgi:C-terminal processing protease CtpA/Prc